MRKAFVGLMSAAVLAVGAASAEAQTRTWNVCGGNAFNTCASVVLTVSGQNVTVRVWNLSGFNGTYAGTVFTGVGFENIGTASVNPSPVPTMTGPVRGSDTPAAWTLSNNTNIGGGIKLDIVGTSGSVNNGIASGCAAAGQLPGGTNELWMNPCTVPGGSGYVEISFTVSGTWNVASTYLLVKGQNGPPGANDSTQCITGGDKQNCFDTNVVPEPITIALLGSGLAGIGGVGAFRRRRKKDEVQV